MILFFLIINFIIFFSWFLFFLRLKKTPYITTIVYVGILGAGQIVFTELVLGILGILYRHYLVVFNLIISTALGCLAFQGEKAHLSSQLKEVFYWVLIGGKRILRWENVLLILLLVFLSFWFLTSSLLLPPRGIDDLVYHLPPLYQYVQTHKIDLLPIDLRGSFAMPLNGDFLFLWVLIFFHDDTFIDLVQFFVVLYGVFVVFAFAKFFSLPSRESFFISNLFVFTPVILGQAGSNYNDVITAVIYLTLSYCLSHFYRSGEFFHLAIGGWVTGFGLGTKYSLLFFFLSLQPIIWLQFFKNRKFVIALRNYILYWVMALPLGCFWYIRNFLETGNPLYPWWQKAISKGLVPTPIQVLKPKVGSSSAVGGVLENPGGFFSFPFLDLGLGSFHGGFGVIFWGLGLISVVFCLIQGLKKAFKKDFFPLFFWGQIGVVFYSLSLLGLKDFQFNQRYILFVLGFGLIAIGILFQKFKKDLPFSVPILKLFCVGFSFLAVIHLASYGWPSYQIKGAVQDWVNDQQTSQYKYFRQSPWDLPSLSLAWEPLDYLTRSTDGWDVYMAATHGVFWVTPTFGSQIQNRIWNFEENPTKDPDAFIFHYDRRVMKLFYLGKKITPDEILRDERYRLVTHATYTTFWVKGDLLKNPEVSSRLADYYKKTFPPAIQTASKLSHLVEEDGVVITSSPLGFGFIYLSLSGKIKSKVLLAPKGKEGVIAARVGAEKVYTVGITLKGYQVRPLAELSGPQGPLFFYENKKL